jgi:hypothetical protein
MVIRRYVSPVAVLERRNNANCDPLKGCSDAVLVHQTPTSGSETLAGGTDVTLLTTPLDVAP